MTRTGCAKEGEGGGQHVETMGETEMGGGGRRTTGAAGEVFCKSIRRRVFAKTLRIRNFFFLLRIFWIERV
jgi:hypothetical protein